MWNESTFPAVSPVLMRMISFMLILFVASTLSFADIELNEDGNPIEFTFATMSDGVGWK